MVKEKRIGNYPSGINKEIFSDERIISLGSAINVIENSNLLSSQKEKITEDLSKESDNQKSPEFSERSKKQIGKIFSTFSEIIGRNYQQEDLPNSKVHDQLTDTEFETVENWEKNPDGALKIIIDKVEQNFKIFRENKDELEEIGGELREFKEESVTKDQQEENVEIIIQNIFEFVLKTPLAELDENERHSIKKEICRVIPGFKKHLR